MAVPSARNSGFDSTSKCTLGAALARRIASMVEAVLTGTVDFSTTMVSLWHTRATDLAALCAIERSAARPAPIPALLVGVFTAMNTMSAVASTLSSVVKKRLRPRVARTTSVSPGS